AIVLSLAANTTFYRQTGLTPNAPQQAYAQAFNPAISTNSGNSTVVYTLANPPTGTAVTFRSSNTVTLAWNANGNPAGTEYRLQGATSVPLLALASFSTTTATSFSFNTLTADTTWFFRVRARNGGGVDTAFDATVSTLTLPAPPAAPSAPDVVARSTGSLTWGVDGSRRQRGRVPGPPGLRHRGAGGHAAGQQHPMASDGPHAQRAPAGFRGVF
ncbi:MAG TPA: fibronectin type III domain-containing protein, partial [Elusimicrobiota bacterium]|nr:fibronectin type III domain-containing protein [Elusimicrobiota bacterium]